LLQVEGRLVQVPPGRDSLDAAFRQALTLAVSYRGIAYRQGNDFHWFRIGTHESYNKLLARLG
jgi:hypothetical protein